jgi:hypothetical protein
MLPRSRKEYLSARNAEWTNDRDLNASINIARRVMSSAGWRSGESPEPANEAGGEKPQLNAGSLVLQDGVAHLSPTWT